LSSNTQLHITADLGLVFSTSN